MQNSKTLKVHSANKKCSMTPDKKRINNYFEILEGKKFFTSCKRR